MKKIITIISCVMLPCLSFAQLKVNEVGNASIGGESPYNYTNLRIDKDLSGETVYGVASGLVQKLKVNQCTWASGIEASAWAPVTANSQASTTGLKATAGNGKNGYNYGIVTTLIGTNRGTGILASNDGTTGLDINGNYAGYFIGETYFDGTVTATNYLIPSDINLKENVKSLSATQTASTLGNIMGIDVITYNYKSSTNNANTPRYRVVEAGDSLQTIEEWGNAKSVAGNTSQKQTHYGLSAQELQKIYPDLVHEAQDGSLSVNYIELVPILIRSIQELKEELDQVKNNGNIFKTRSIEEDTGNSYPLGAENVLYQNTPNPFSVQTTIRFRLADDVQNAAICIFDMSGKQLKRIPVSQGMTSVTVNGYELGEGLYLYSLVVNGREIDTKRMILSK